VVGGWSRMLREFLELQLMSPTNGLKTSGVPVALGGGEVGLIYAELRQLLSDGDGLRLALQWMGQGCTKPCFKHWNVMRKGSDLAWRSDGGPRAKLAYVSHSCGPPFSLIKA